MIKVKSFKKLKSGKKKYEITFEKNGKTYVRKFGAAGMSDFTIHKDRERRERYISRHKKDLRTGDPMKPGYLSMYILWNKPSLKASLADYKRRLNVYNRTGKFPTGISGSKKLSFGMRNSAEIKDILADKVRWDPAQLILEYTATPELQKLARGYLARSFVKSKRYLKMILLAINIDHYKRRRVANPEQRASEEMEPDSGTPWEALDPRRYETAFFMRKCAIILNRSDKDDLLWYNCMFAVLEEIALRDPEYNRYPKNVSDNLESCVDSVIELLPVLTDPQVYPDLDHPRWYLRAIMQIEENEQESEDENAFGKKNTSGGSKIPDNVINKKLYASIKAKIRRSIKGRRWGAYDSGRLVREYKSAGGGYSGKKGKTNLGRWYKEKWVDACAWPKRKSCGRKTKEKIAYCRPSKRVDSKTPKLVQKLTKAQIKSRCAKKKKNPMKRVTKFGQTTPGYLQFGAAQEVIDKMRQQMYNQIMTSSDVSSGIENTISKRCKRGFQDSFCQSIFTDLLLSIYYTIVKNSVLTDNRKRNISEMEKFIPNNFKPTSLKINKSQFSKIDEMLYSLQDHTYGTFKNARVASLIYEYIHVK